MINPNSSGDTPSEASSSRKSVTVTKEMADAGGKYFGETPDPAKTKHYYIAAEPVNWAFAPTGQDLVCGKPFPPDFLARPSSPKMRYVQYADPAFTERILPQERLGIMGPVLRGVTGQYLEITFLNRCKQPLSMHPHGVKYDKDSEGAYYQPSPGLGAAVAPDAKFTYVWYCDEKSGPLPDEPSSKGWLYHSHAGPIEEINDGLFGFIVVTDAARARPDGTPEGIDREMAAAYMIFNENQTKVSVGDGDPDREAPTAAPLDKGPIGGGERFTINGLAYGNLSGLELNEGERVRWYLFGLGSESDLHTSHWHGLRVIESGRRTDTVELLPANMKVADMVAENPGTWLFHCHVAEHMANGMYTALRVHPASHPLASRDPGQAFFGMPQGMQSLRFDTADLSPGDGGAGSTEEIGLSGTLAVPDLYVVAGTQFSIAIGNKTLALAPDKTGLCRVAEATLLVKNAINAGAIQGGKLEFDLTLHGNGWIQELRRQGILAGQTLVADRPLRLDLLVGGAHHVATVLLKLVGR